MKTSVVEKLINYITDEMAVSVEIVDRHQRQGYNHTFELVDNQLMCVQTRQYFHAKDFQVDQINKIDQLGYVYALHHRSQNFKGIFVAYLSLQKTD